VADDYEINLSSLHRHRIRPDVGDLRGRKNGYGPRRSTRAHWYFQRRVAFAIGSIFNRLPSNLAWFAVGDQPMPIICALRNPGHLAVRRAMSSRCHFVEYITVTFIAVATKPLGGIRPVLTRPLPLDPCGCRHTHCCEMSLLLSSAPESQNYLKPIHKALLVSGRHPNQRILGAVKQMNRRCTFVHLNFFC
jgi:hypothetical protein